MRELENFEVDRVSGGGGASWVIPAAIGATMIGSGFAGYRSGGWKGAVLGTGLGGIAAGCGVMIGATAGAARAAWFIRSAAWTAIGGLAGGGHAITPDPVP